MLRWIHLPPRAPLAQHTVAVGTPRVQLTLWLPPTWTLRSDAFDSPSWHEWRPDELAGRRLRVSSDVAANAELSAPDPVTTTLLTWLPQPLAEFVKSQHDNPVNSLSISGELLRHEGRAGSCADTEHCGMEGATIFEQRIVIGDGLVASFSAPASCFRGCWASVAPFSRMGLRWVDSRSDHHSRVELSIPWDPLSAVPRTRVSVPAVTRKVNGE